LVDTIPPSQSSHTPASTDQHLHDNDSSEDTATASDSALNASGNDDTSSHVKGIDNRNADTRNDDTCNVDNCNSDTRNVDIPNVDTPSLGNPAPATATSYMIPEDQAVFVFCYF
jgi:hypothetical protein